MLKQQKDESGVADACPACGGPVACGVANGEQACWCFALPHMLPMPTGGVEARCYCSACLKALIDERAAQ